MKKAALSLGLIILFSAYVLYRRIGLAEVNYIAPEFSQLPLPASSPTATPTPYQDTNLPIQPTPINKPTRTPIPTSVPTPKKNLGQYKDGQYIGSVADAYYGNVQVRVVIQDGRIVDVIFLDHPQDRRTSIENNNYAMPYLKQEAIQIQNANVDIISGATATSGAFRESLASALSQAL